MPDLKEAVGNINTASARLQRPRETKTHCPGASSVPATSEPHMTVLAPSENAFTICKQQHTHVMAKRTKLQRSGAINFEPGAMHRGKRFSRWSNLAGVGDSSVSNHWDSKLASILGDVVHGGCLGTAARTHFLRRADRSNTHTDTEPVDTSTDQVAGLSRKNEEQHV